MKIVIIGGVAGGASAAARLRRLDEQAEIIVFERSGYMSYANCGLPYYIGGTITDSQKLTLQTPQSFWTRFHIDVRVHHEAIKVDIAGKKISVRNLQTGEVFEESYDKLLLSPGATPVKPSLPGVESEGIFTLRTVEDTLHIAAVIQGQGGSSKPRSALVVGAGFVGIETAENLAALGITVTMVEYADQVLGILDKDIACAVQNKLRAQGVRLLLQKGVTAFSRQGDAIVTTLTDGSTLTSDMVLLAMGVTPDSKLAHDAGLTLGPRGSIVVNDKMETSAPDIYAVGDAVVIQHSVTGQTVHMPLAGPANKQGRIAADNMCGGDSHYHGAQGTSVIKVFDMTVACTGINEKIAAAAGFSYDKVVLTPNSHAAYYPGAKPLTIKIIYQKGTARLLGAQVVGYDGVDKRIDVLSTAIFAGLPATRLPDLDLAYAPPYSSAKDPVNMAGYVVENLESGKVKQIHYYDLPKLPRDGSVTLLDARTPKEYAKGCAPDFINIPLDELRDRLAEIPMDKPVYVMCQSGLRSYIACRILSQRGYDCYNFSGGYIFYKMTTLDAEVPEHVLPCGKEGK